MLTTKKSREEMFISTSTKPKAWVRPRTINQNIEIMKYYVSVTEMLNTVVRAEAESEKEAIDKAKYEYSDGVIELTREDNYSGEQFEIDDDQEYWREAEENGNTVLQHID